MNNRSSFDIVTVSQFLYSPIGEQLLTRLGEVIQTESRLSGFYAIRSALILAANDPQGFTPIAVLRQFPTSGIRIDLTKSTAIVAQSQQLIRQTDQAVIQIDQQADQAAAMPLPADLPSVNLENPGPFAWEVRSIVIQAPQRDRRFPADIYMPLSSAPSPLIVISHGLGSDRYSFAYLAQHLASYGFAVAVPEHPGSNAEQLQALFQGTAAQVTSPEEFIDRPLDVTDLLDALAELSQSDPSFQGRFRLQAVGVIGQSYGGYTALALAGAQVNGQLQTDCSMQDNSLNLSLFLQCLALQLPEDSENLADARIAAAIAINPVTSSILGPSGLSQIQIPTMIVAGSADTITPALPEQIQPFSWLTTPDKYLVLIDGATHFLTIDESPNAVISIPSSAVGSSPELARRYVKLLSVAFFQTYLGNQPNYRSFLTAAYMNRISRSPLPIHLVRSLPPLP